jgi:GTP cyclohydrolase II
MSLETSLANAQRSLDSEERYLTVQENGAVVTLKTTKIGNGPLLWKTKKRKSVTFSLQVFTVNDIWEEYHVLTYGDITKAEEILLRVGSGCETGQIFGDRSCECREQLDETMERIVRAGAGIVIHIPKQDGRGRGLAYKLALMGLQQDLSIDTVAASKLLDPEGRVDTRTYAGACALILTLGIQKDRRIRLLTNNPDKLTIFRDNGFDQTDCEEIVIAPTEETTPHLKAKQKELGHRNLIDEAS